MQNVLNQNLIQSGSFFSYQTLAINVKVNDYVIIKGFPCRVTSVQTSLPGKHIIKTYIEGISIFTGKKYKDVTRPQFNVEIPYVQYTQYQLIDISDDNYLTVLLENGQTKEDVKLPDDQPQLIKNLKANLKNQKDILVTILSAMGLEKLISYREISN
ncbi:hypothetical protein ABPG72_019037 [Tetrahymena utriculariae]